MELPNDISLEKVIRLDQNVNGHDNEVKPDKMENETACYESDSESVSTMDTNDGDDSERDIMRENLLDCVARSDGFFKSQQIGESDLTYSEKREIAGDLLTKNVPLFLQRYWKYLNLQDIPYFDDQRSDYEVNFYMKEIVKSHNSRAKKLLVKNRRFVALSKMIEEGSYFSDAEMKRRNPFLFDQMIGQHLTEKERQEAYKKEHPDQKFSAFLMNQMEKNVENCLFDKQKNEDEAIEEEDDDDDDTSEEEYAEEPVKKMVSDVEKQQLRTEFTLMMHESFLDGKDKDFDYSFVDNNADYDSLQQRDIDEEEKYFDEESSHGSDCQDKAVYVEHLLFNDGNEY